MRNWIVAILAALALCLGLSVQTASAYRADPAINGAKFYTGTGGSPAGICVGPGQGITSAYRVAYIAQKWNNVIGTDVVALNYEANCAAAGYPPSRRMVIGTYSGSGSCAVMTNDDYVEHNGFAWWTNGPGEYIQSTFLTCSGSQARRDHQVSLAIGWLLGLEIHNSSAWNSRVMNETQWSRDNVPFPTATEGQKVREIYLGVFCDVGTDC